MLIGDGISVRVYAGEAEVFIQFVYEPGGTNMLQLLGHFMHFIPGEAQFFNEKGFPQPVFPDH